jgi:HlyD family secretion protein
LVSPAQATVELTSSGYVVAQKVSKASTKIAGRVQSVHVKQGDTVHEGDLLFEIDPIDQKAAIASALSQSASARARVQTAHAVAAETRQQADRERTLVAEGISPKATLQNLEAHLTALEETAKAAQAEVEASDALVSALRINLGNFTVKAPISGTILNKPPEPGEIVAPQPSGVAVDMGGVEIADFSTLMVETDVPEQRLHQIKMGGPGEITLDAFPDHRYRGKAIEITPQVNRAKATVVVKVAFVDEKDGVLPDMSARVSFLSGELDKDAIKAPPKIIVPSAAIADRNGAKVVFVIDDGVVHMIPVTLGPAFGGGFELTRGPRPGTHVVKNPPAELGDGQRIKERTLG